MNSALVSEVLKHYCIGSCISFERLNFGTFGANYKLLTTENAFILKVTGIGANTNSELAYNFIESMRASGLPCLTPVLSSKKMVFIEIEHRKFELFRFTEATSSKISISEIAQIAEKVAKLSLLNIPFEPSALSKENSSSFIELEKGISAIQLNVFNINELFAERTQRFTCIKNLNLPKGLIHGNLNSGNVLFENGKLSAIIDFDSLSYDYLIIEIGIAINNFCYSKNKLNPKLVQTFLTEYNALRKLSFEELSHLPCVIQYSALVILYNSLQKNFSFEPTKKQINYIAELSERAQSQTALHAAEQAIAYLVKQWVGFEFK